MTAWVWTDLALTIGRIVLVLAAITAAVIVASAAFPPRQDPDRLPPDHPLIRNTPKDLQ